MVERAHGARAGTWPARLTISVRLTGLSAQPPWIAGPVGLLLEVGLHHTRVRVLALRRVDEHGMRMVADQPSQVLDGLGIVVELAAEASGELLGLRLVVAIPMTQVGARGDLLDPDVHLAGVFGDSARPDAIDEDTVRP